MLMFALNSGLQLSRSVALQQAGQCLALAEITSTDDSFVAAVRALTGGGVDAAFEAIGLTTTADQALAMIRPGRTAYLVGVPPIDSAMSVPGAFMVLQAKGLQGLFMGNSNFKVEMPNLARHYLEGRLELDRLVSAHITLDEVNEGFV